MKLQEILKTKKKPKTIIILNEGQVKRLITTLKNETQSQFLRLAENVLNEQFNKTIRNTHLIRVKSAN